MNMRSPDSGQVALIHNLLAKPMSGEAIEQRSFELIEQALAESKSGQVAEVRPGLQDQVIKRLIHTSGDLELAKFVNFSPDAIDAAIIAFRRGAKLIVDSQMIRAGLSQIRLRHVCESYGPESIICHIADSDVAIDAKAAGLPRALFALRKARALLDGGIALFGNSPVALLELNRLVIEEGVRPALIIGFPVGFVHVVEAKQELEQIGVPYITIDGRRGGSPLAVAAAHALCSIAERASREGHDVFTAGAQVTERTENGKSNSLKPAVILMGHGSRFPEASRDMELVAERLRASKLYHQVEICYMAQNVPTLDQALDACRANNAKEVVVVPYFLHFGAHLREDIPVMLKEKTRSRPGLRISLGRHLGYDPALVALVARRIDESIDSPLAVFSSEENSEIDNSAPLGKKIERN